MICSLIRAINEASMYYKNEHCGGGREGKKANFNKVWRQINPKEGVF